MLVLQEQKPVNMDDYSPQSIEKSDSIMTFPRYNYLSPTDSWE